MRVSREKAAEHREQIIDAAGALFRSKGFGGVGVADIMKAAEPTIAGTAYLSTRVAASAPNCRRIRTASGE